MKNKLDNLTPKLLGEIGVDTGMVWIGDPCNIGDAQELLHKFWSDKVSGSKMYKSFNYKHGSEGLGVCTTTKDGDGTFNVIGFFEHDSDTPSCVIIDFDEIFNDIIDK
ncbi:MAG TPA: hypothetical protein VN026_00145 [Bacteroidia bacterium]|jgi:hypothetical protein|nr:hypothetical protein [Bacteroidia bacterium]